SVRIWRTLPGASAWDSDDAGLAANGEREAESASVRAASAVALLCMRTPFASWSTSRTDRSDNRIEGGSPISGTAKSNGATARYRAARERCAQLVPKHAFLHS